MDKDFIAMERDYVKRLDRHDRVQFVRTPEMEKEETRLRVEQVHEYEEKRRSGMPGSIRRNGKWTRERKDGPMAFQARADWMVRD